jgi:hypothetical protein
METLHGCQFSPARNPGSVYHDIDHFVNEYGLRKGNTYKWKIMQEEKHAGLGDVPLNATLWWSQAGLSQRLKVVETRQQLWPLSSIRRDKTISSSLNFQALALGLPFSDKKLFRGIRNKTEQTAVPSEFRLFSGREKPRNSVPSLGIPFRTISRKRKTLGILFRTIYRKRKPLGIPFRTIYRKRKTLGIPFRTIFGWEKPRNSVPNHFRKRKNLGKNDFCWLLR